MLAGPMAETVCSTVFRQNYPQPLQKRTAPFPIRRGVHTREIWQPSRSTSVREAQKSEQCDAPNGNLLSLGLLKHPDRQPAAVGDRGRSPE